MFEKLPPPSQPFLIKNELSGIMQRPPLILCGNGNPTLGQNTVDHLAELICERNGVSPANKTLLMTDLYDMPAGRWPDGETHIRSIIPNCDARQIFIFQTPYPNPDVRIREVTLMLDALNRTGATDKVVILPYYAYGRSDTKSAPRVPIAASAVTREYFNAGANRLIVMEPHVEQILGMTEKQISNIFASKILVPKILELVEPDNTVIMFPDFGAKRRAEIYNIKVGSLGTAGVEKKRKPDSEEASGIMVDFVGDVTDRNVVIVDDEAVSMGSIRTAAWAAHKRSARRIFAAVTHFKDAEDNRDFPKMWKNLNEMPPNFEKLIITDSIDHLKIVKDHPLVEIVDTSRLWAEVVWRTAFGYSLSPDLVD